MSRRKSFVFITYGAMLASTSSGEHLLIHERKQTHILLHIPWIQNVVKVAKGVE